MADFSGNTLTATATYNETTKVITVTDTTDYVGEGITRTDADILFYPFHKPSTGDSSITMTADSTDPTAVASWTKTLSSSDRDGRYQFNLIYAFDFAALATHQLGDVVRSGGLYYIYTSSTASAAAVTDTTKWKQLTTYDATARVQTTVELLITRLSETILFNLRQDFIEADNDPRDALPTETIVKGDVYLESASAWFQLGSYAQAQEFIEVMEELGENT